MNIKVKVYLNRINEHIKQITVEANKIQVQVKYDKRTGSSIVLGHPIDVKQTLTRIMKIDEIEADEIMKNKW